MRISVSILISIDKNKVIVLNKVIISKQKIYFASLDPNTNKWQKQDIARLGKPLPWYLVYDVEFDKNVTVLDFLNVLKKHEDHINLVFCGYLGETKLDDFIQEANLEPESNFKEDLECIEFFWETELTPLEIEEDEETEFKISNYPSVRGVCAFHAEGEISEDGTIEFEVNDEIDISLISIRNYANEILSINKYIEYSVIDDISDPLPSTLLDGEMHWSLYDLIAAFLSEISYYGTPANQKTVREETQKEHEELENLQTVIEQPELFAYLESLDQRIDSE